MRLPSGQAIARAIGVDPIPDSKLLLGKEEDNSDPSRPTVSSINPVFADNCPLWVYVLAEAAHEYHQHKTKLPVLLENGGTTLVGTPQLGDVGGRIVGETFAGLMLDDANSYWNVFPKFKPYLHRPLADRAQWSISPNLVAHPFKLADFVAYALGDGLV